MKLRSIYFFSAVILMAFPGCNTKGKELNQNTSLHVSLMDTGSHAPDSLILKYKNQARPEGYTGLMMYDLLALAYTPMAEFTSALDQSGYNWKKVAESNDLTFENMQCRQYISKISDDELFFLDYTPHHKTNFQYLKANGYFSYEDTQIGNSYFNCDSIFVTWRPNDDPNGGSGLLLYNMSE